MRSAAFFDSFYSLPWVNNFLLQHFLLFAHLWKCMFVLWDQTRLSFCNGKEKYLSFLEIPLESYILRTNLLASKQHFCIRWNLCHVLASIIDKFFDRYVQVRVNQSNVDMTYKRPKTLLKIFQKRKHKSKISNP